MHVAQLFFRDIGADTCHAARQSARGAAGIHHRAVVFAVTGGLYNHIARETQMIAQFEKFLFARIAGRVFAFWGKWKFG